MYPMPRWQYMLYNSNSVLLLLGHYIEFFRIIANIVVVLLVGIMNQLGGILYNVLYGPPFCSADTVLEI